MAKDICPECDGALVRMPTKKKGMEVLKHKDAAAARVAGCGMGFITVRTKGAVANGEKEAGKGKEISGAGAKGGNEETGGGGGGYREAVRSAGKSGKRGGRSAKQSARHVPERRAAATGGGADSREPKISKRGWLDDVTDTIFRK